MEEKEEQIKVDEKTKFLQDSSVSLILGSYNDIFSDFDPRHYSERSLSDDFLVEAKKATIDKRGEIELKLLISNKIRNVRTEGVIKKRLREHFRRHHHIIKTDVNRIIKQGVYFVIAGILLMFLATYILFKNSEARLFTSFLVVFLEPAGWFLFWEGSDLVLFETKKKRPDLEFYEKMSKCKISFLSY